MKKNLLFVVLNLVVGCLHGAETKRAEELSLGQQLYNAANADNIQLVTQLLKDGADVNWTDQNGMTPLIIASLKDRVSVIKLLLQSGARIEAKNVFKDDCGGETALVAAAAYGKLAAVQVLLAHGADVNALTGKGKTALMFASINGHCNVVQFLLQHKATIDIKDAGGISAIFYGVTGNKEACLQMLIRAGADVNEEATGWNPLSTSVDSNKPIATKVLLGVPSLSHDTIKAIYTGNLANNKSKQFVKYALEGKYTEFFLLLKLRDVAAIKKAIKKIKDIANSFYNHGDPNLVYWENPLHVTIKRHKEIVQGMTKEQIEKEEAKTIEILGLLSSINPQQWYEANSANQTPLDYLLGTPLHKKVLPIIMGEKKEEKREKESAQTAVVTSSSQSSVSTAPKKVGKEARERLKQRIESGR